MRYKMLKQIKPDVNDKKILNKINCNYPIISIFGFLHFKNKNTI